MATTADLSLRLNSYLLTSPTCTDWERKGESHYKDGQFTKK
ncbi:multiple cyclophane-containing RiPP AmcA [Actinophytocola sp.]